MSDHDLSKQPLFGVPVVRHVVQEPIRIERPAGDAAAQVAAPPDPASAVGGHAIPAEGAAAPTAPPPNEAQTIAQLGMALYLLQALHLPDKPGYEHLRSEGPPEAPEDPEAAPD